MNKKILILCSAIAGVAIVTMFGDGYLGELSSSTLMSPRRRIILPRSDMSYVSCKKYESLSAEGIDFKVYLSSAKKTYAITTDTKRTLDVSSIINEEFFRNQKIALGQSNPSRIKYDISYTSNNITLLSSIFVNGIGVRCPNVVLPIPPEFAYELATTGIPICSDVIAGLTENEKIGISCVGNSTIRVDKDLASYQVALNNNTSSSLLGNLLFPSVLAFTTIPPDTSGYEPPTTEYEPPTTEENYDDPAIPLNNKERRCENGVNINDYMNCRCPEGKIRTYEQDSFIVVACVIKAQEKVKESLGKKIKGGLGLGSVTIPADKNGRGGESGWGVTGRWDF